MDEPKSAWPRRVGLLVVVLLGLGLVGAIGHFSGSGWFGYRSILYGSGELYTLNLGPTPLFVTVDGRGPTKIKPEDAAIVDLVGGTSDVRITDESGTEIDRRDISIDDSHAFFKVAGPDCAAAVDVTPYYGGNPPKDPDILWFVRGEREVYIPQSKNVIWPRKVFPRKLDGYGGKGVWFALIGCDLIEDRNVLNGYLVFRLQERLKKSMGKDAVDNSPPPPRKTKY